MKEIKKQKEIEKKETQRKKLIAPTASCASMLFY